MSAFLPQVNAPVPQLLKSGMFRSDLFHRLCVFHVELPLWAQKTGYSDAGGAFSFITRPGCIIRLLGRRAGATRFPWTGQGTWRELENVILGHHLKKRHH